MLDWRPLVATIGRTLAVAVGGAALLAAQAAEARESAAPLASAGETHVVTALGTNWDRREVSAVQGDRVEWRWQDGFHDLWIVDAAVPLGEEAAAEERLSGDIVTPGAPAITRELTEAGAWDFYCKIHNGRGSDLDDMSGTITVAPGESDTLAPATTATLDPPNPGPGGTYAGPVTITLTATDAGGSGVDLTRYRIDGGADTPYGGPITVSAPGPHSVAYASTDNAGNAEAEQQVAFTIASGGSGAPPAPPAPPADDPIPPARPALATLRPLPKRLSGAALAKGLRVSGSCAEVATGRLTLTVSARQAARLGLPRKRATLARAAVACANGTFGATLTPKRKTRKALAKLRRSVKATLALTMSGTGGTVSDTTPLTIKGRKAKRG
jgi:plastocyanin